jgi:hypothetical protein
MTSKKDIPYLERLRSELVQSISRQQERPKAAVWWKTRSAVVGAAAAAVLAAGAVSAVILTGGSSDDAPGPPDRGSGSVAASCVEQFSIETLARRDFAFDGTITEIIPPEDPEAEKVAAAAEVVFDVHRWYKGGGGETVTLKTYELPGAISSIEGSLDLSVGNRLLASGDDVYLWSCGFSKPYSEANAQLYQEAFRA